MKKTDNTNQPERKTMLSILWIFLSVNYIMCDVFTSMEAPVLQQLIKGQVAGMNVTQELLLFAAISLEIPFIMIVLSRVLPFKTNKILNVAASVLMIVYQLGSFFVGTASLHYIFFSFIEVACNGIILLIALKWVNRNENKPIQGDN